jgi:hypothetical protein
MTTTEVRITKKQKLAMIIMGVSATLTQAAQVHGMIKANGVAPITYAKANRNQI